MTRSEATATKIAGPLRDYHNKVREHAAARLRDLEHLEPAQISQRLRRFLKIEDERLRIAQRCGASGHWTAKARCYVLDVIIEYAFRATAWSEEGSAPITNAMDTCAVIALGGYGRGELAPFSDLDLLFLHTGRRTAQVKQLVERLLRLLWDAGLTVGHSFRTSKETVAASHTDLHLETALTHTRLLAGNLTLFDCFVLALERDRRKRSQAFITAVLKERAERYGKFGDAVC